MYNFNSILASLDGFLTSMAVKNIDVPEIEWYEDFQRSDLLKSEDQKLSEWKGHKGVWRRVGRFNLFIRDKDGIIMSGPRALQGQKMSDITSDDFKAISFVKEIFDDKGHKAVPGPDIRETFSGVSTTTMTADHAVAEVRRGISKVLVTLYVRVNKNRKEKIEEKSFDFEDAKEEVQAFEDAKAWARLRLRDKGSKAIKAKNV